MNIKSILSALSAAALLSAGLAPNASAAQNQELYIDVINASDWAIQSIVLNDFEYEVGDAFLPGGQTRLEMTQVGRECIYELIINYNKDISVSAWVDVCTVEGAVASEQDISVY